MIIFANFDNGRFTLTSIFTLEILWFDFHEESYILLLYFFLLQIFFFIFYYINIDVIIVAVVGTDLRLGSILR